MFNNWKMENIKTIIKKRIVKLIPKPIKRQIEKEFINTDFYRFQNLSFAQEGEDLILDRFLENREKGFYIDIGAYHPIRFSNTYRFYLRGWRGINIDAMPGCMDNFKKIRPRDINLEIPVSEKNQILKYYIFSETAFNTFSENVAKKHIELHNATKIQETELHSMPLYEILNNYMPQNTLIDFMTIDIEGLELPVLKSNDWERYKPEYILVETLRNSLCGMDKNNIFKYITQLGYILVAKTYNTMLFNYSKMSKEV